MTRWTRTTCSNFFELKGNRVWDIDGFEYLDFALGDTGAMAGHSPEATVAAIQHRIATLGGLTTMLPTEDAEWVGGELTRRFGLERWSFSLTATDANRWDIRLARALTGRSKIAFNSYCYHGSVDESLIVVGPGGEGMSRPGNVGEPVDVTATSRVAEYNDLDGLERQLAHGDVAAVLMEPALTNIAIVLPEACYLEGVRELTRRYSVLLINDETHTFSAGPGGATGAWRLDPDMLVIGKSVAGGIPMGRHHADAISQYGADVAGHQRRGYRAPSQRFRGGDHGASRRLTTAPRRVATGHRRVPNGLPVSGKAQRGG